ncbi:hypothetical protein E4T56_gene4369 [Termitomyces sp. T112]|nr:hypothetical protein E4T56_gene4369 [Termitomyces sp. T112]
MSAYDPMYNSASYLTNVYGNSADDTALHNGPPQDRPPHFNLHTLHVNAPPPCQNVPAPLRQPTGPRAPQPSFPINSPCSPPALMPNPPTNTNYFGLPTPGGPLPLGGPQGLPQAMQAKPPVAGLPMADLLEDGAWP